MSTSVCVMPWSLHSPSRRCCSSTIRRVRLLAQRRHTDDSQPSSHTNRPCVFLHAATTHDGQHSWPISNACTFPSVSAALTTAHLVSRQHSSQTEHVRGRILATRRAASHICRHVRCLDTTGLQQVRRVGHRERQRQRQHLHQHPHPHPHQQRQLRQRHPRSQCRGHRNGHVAAGSSSLPSYPCGGGRSTEAQ